MTVKVHSFGEAVAMAVDDYIEAVFAARAHLADEEAPTSEVACGHCTDAVRHARAKLSVVIDLALSSTETECRCPCRGEP